MRTAAEFPPFTAHCPHPGDMFLTVLGRPQHHMWEVEEDGCRCAFVAKFTKTAVTAESIFEDAKLSMISQMYADMFNRVSNVDKKVAFLPSYVLILQDRGNKLCCSEPILHGEYVKHNNNDGAVATARLVPQAFSHFTWEASKHKLLICDIQGVGDYYTDPQILSADGHGFGQGNCGMDSIVKYAFVLALPPHIPNTLPAK